MPGMKKSASTSNLLANISLSFSARNHVVSSQAKPKKKSRRTSMRRTLTDDTINSQLSTNLKEQIAQKTESELMANFFKTASELEDLAKKTRRANRRRSSKTKLPGRSRSKIIENPILSLVDEDDDCSVGSTKSTFSLRGLLSPNLNKKQPETPLKSKRGSKSARSSRPRRSRSVNGRIGGTLLPQCGQDLDASLMDNSAMIGESVRRAAANKAMEQFKPTFYMDSDDDDDDLILDADDSLDEMSQRIRKEVMNMTINVS